jgi:hypothetical protein
MARVREGWIRASLSLEIAMNADPALSLAEHVSHTSFTDLTSEVVIATKRDILDTLGAMLGGSVAPGVAELTGLVKHWGGREESSLILLERGGQDSSPGRTSRASPLRPTGRDQGR